jgi:hypothetical protein
MMEYKVFSYTPGRIGIKIATGRSNRYTHPKKLVKNTAKMNVTPFTATRIAVAE